MLLTLLSVASSIAASSSAPDDKFSSLNLDSSDVRSSSFPAGSAVERLVSEIRPGTSGVSGVLVLGSFGGIF